MKNDSLLPEVIEREAGTLGLFAGKIHYYSATASTNDLALQSADHGAAEGSVFIADAQTRGRGKLGREWLSTAATGIYVSVILRPAVPPIKVPLLTLLAAIAVVEALTAALGEVLPEGRRPALDVKWPNDVLLNSKKVCGILSEAALRADQICYAVVGIGINVHHDSFPPPLDATATSLFLETGHKISRVKLLVHLLKRLQTWYKEFSDSNFDSILARWSQLSSYANGKRITIQKDGALISGVTRGLNADGALRLELPDGHIETIYAGEIHEPGA
jgi:BirA family biotin operon repressor/biotin-[acetyl-CoA-carboxylase] ligase